MTSVATKPAKQVNEKIAKSKTRKSEFKKVKKSPHHQTISKLIRDEDFIGSSITFIFADTSRQTQEVKKAFATTSKGRYRKISDLIMDLNSICWDLAAEEYEIN